MRPATTNRRKLREIGLDQHGYVTTRDAQGLGIPVVELRKLAARGGLEHVAYGLYRFEDIPRTPGDQYMEAVLRVGRDAYLSHDAVLDLLGLGLVNPRRIRVGTPHRVRASLPEHLEVSHRHLASDELTRYEGIPATTVARAFLDCRGLVMSERLIEAAQSAARQGLLRRSEVATVIEGLRASA